MQRTRIERIISGDFNQLSPLKKAVRQVTSDP